MTPCHANNLFDHSLTEKLPTGETGSRIQDQVMRFGGLQKTHSEGFRIHKVPCPVHTHLAESVHPAEEQSHMGTVLDRTAEPIQQQAKIEIAGLASFLDLFKFIEKHENRAAFSFQHLFQAIKPFIEVEIHRCLVPMSSLLSAVTI